MKIDLREPLRPEDGYLIILVLIVLFVLAIFTLPGCQTVGGVCRDLESVGRYGRQHIHCDSSEK